MAALINHIYFFCDIQLFLHKLNSKFIYRRDIKEFLCRIFVGDTNADTVLLILLVDGYCHIIRSDRRDIFTFTVSNLLRLERWTSPRDQHVREVAALARRFITSKNLSH